MQTRHVVSGGEVVQTREGHWVQLYTSYTYKYVSSAVRVRSHSNVGRSDVNEQLVAPFYARVLIAVPQQLRMESLA